MPNCPTQSCLILEEAAPTYEIEKLLLVVGLQLVDKLYTSLEKLGQLMTKKPALTNRREKG